MREKVLWCNFEIDEDDWKDGIDWFLEDEGKTFNDIDDSKVMEIIYDLLDIEIDDIRTNLDITLSNPILVICDIGRWNGRVTGYKIINSGNIKDIFFSDCDFCKWYSDGYNLKFIGHHHDGTNYYEYREIKNMDNIDNLLDRIVEGKEISRALLSYYTKSILPEIKDIYNL